MAQSAAFPLSAAKKSAAQTVPRRTAGGGINGISDLPPDGWKDADIFSDSLWILGDRDNSGAHDGFYHGNFIPQIPHQLMRRFTRAGDVVLDAFLGSGTTMIEARRLGRNCIGVELLPEVAATAKELALRQPSAKSGIFSEIIVGDSTESDTRAKIQAVLAKRGKKGVDLVVMHPPYHDIVKFSDNPADLCNAGSVDDYVRRFGLAVDNLIGMLSDRHYLAVVIGDKYADSEWVPLGFRLMDEALRRGRGRESGRTSRLALKSVIVKNMVNNRAKRNKEQLWRYRAIKGGFYVFRHEYILLFQKKAK
jgi:hypothetical protein